MTKEKSNVPVTLMIPTCNQETFIAKAIQSVLDQTYDNIEIIVSDDSDNNKTSEIIEKQFKNHVKYCHNNPPKGRIDNYRHLLYELANGDWVINLDGDDYFRDNKFIEKAVALSEKSPDIVFVFTKQIWLDLQSGNERNNDYRHMQGREIVEGDWLLLNTVFRNIELPHLGTMYRRNAAIEKGFYESNIPSTDRESLLKLAVGNKVGFLDTFSGVWVKHDRNKTGHLSVTEIIDDIRMYNTLFGYAKKHSRINTPLLALWKIWAKYKKCYAHLLILIATKKKSDVKEFRRALLKLEPLVYILELLDFRIYKRIIFG